jgi:hypothetical protein
MRHKYPIRTWAELRPEDLISIALSTRAESRRRVLGHYGEEQETSDDSVRLVGSAITGNCCAMNRGYLSPARVVREARWGTPSYCHVESCCTASTEVSS